MNNNNINLQSDLFLGVPEIKSLKDIPSNYINDFINTITLNYGIVKKSTDSGFLNLKVITGSVSNALTLKAGYAIDNQNRVIKVISDLVDFATVPNDSVWYYYAIRILNTSLENGTVNIQSNGQISGNGTDFTKLRAGDFSSLISFPNSVYNTGDYEVASITDSDTAQLVGSNFTVEANLTWKIKGTFTQGIIVADKTLYSYDKYEIIRNTTGTFTSGTEFVLCKAQNNGGTVTITDLRTDFYKTQSFDATTLEGNSASSFAKTTDLDNYVKTTDLDNYVKTTDLDNYVKTTDTSSTNTANKVVLRDSSGNFAAGTITVVDIIIS